MVTRATFRSSVYVAVVAVLLALTGIFSKFGSREVIENTFSLSITVLALLLALGGWLSASQVRGRPGRRVLVGALGGALVGAALSALMFIESFVSLGFVFPNVITTIRSGITFGQDLPVDMLLLVGFGAVMGAAASVLRLLPKRLELVLVGALALTAVMGMLENQIKGIFAPTDVVPLIIAFVLGYGLSGTPALGQGLRRLVAALIAGAVVGLATVAVLGGTQIADPLLRPVLFRAGAPLGAVAALALVSAAGALARRSSALFHDGMWYLVVGVASIGLLHWQNGMTILAALVIGALWLTVLLLAPPRGQRTGRALQALATPLRHRQMNIELAMIVLILVVLPLVSGQYITNVLNAAGLYVLLGIGLNLVVGSAGLLDLGYVAFFAIGAYTVGILTTPNSLTCGGADPLFLTADSLAQTCTGVTTFWIAWIGGVLMAAGAGILLGFPVLRLRGDYLAIVTLGFGEIIRLIVRYDDFKPIFGAAQGIPNTPRPVIDLSSLNPNWVISFSGEIGIYFLILVAIVLTALVARRLVNSRVGRSWRAMRADEDVAQMTGINTTRAKLMAFGIGASFAGLGGAISAVRLYGVYPDSFTVQVSINVLCIIILGGLGSAPGVIVGALVLVGMPEVLRELADYRLLAFGALLVAAMLVRPQGLIPPRPARLAEQLRESKESTS